MKPCRVTPEVVSPIDMDCGCEFTDTFPESSLPVRGDTSSFPESSSWARHTVPRRLGFSSVARLRYERTQRWPTIARPRYSGPRFEVQLEGRPRVRIYSSASFGDSEDDSLYEDCASEILDTVPRRRWHTEFVSKGKKKSRKGKEPAESVISEREQQEQLGELEKLIHQQKAEEEMCQCEQANPLWSPLALRTEQEHLEDLLQGDYYHGMAEVRDKVEQLEYNLLEVQERLKAAELRHEQAQREALQSHQEQQDVIVDRLARLGLQVANQDEDAGKEFKTRRMRLRWL
jgi:hypothetical protein